MTPKITRQHIALFGVALVFGMAPPTRAQSADTDPSQSATLEPTHTLFMGVELAVKRDRQLLPVQDVQGTSIIARRKGKEVRIPTSGKALNLTVTRSLKVTAQSATVDKLRVERSFTDANDPLKKFAAESGAAAGADAVASLALGRMVDASYGNDMAQLAASRTSGPSDTLTAQRKLDQASRDYQTAAQVAQSSTLSPGEAAWRMEGDLAEGNYDAFRATFTVSARQPLSNAYVVVLAQLRVGEAGSDAHYNWVYTKALGFVSQKPVPVYINQAGFPPGYAIERVQVHLFNEGEEIATNVAPMRVELSRDEAFQYSAIEYISQNKGVTSPATLAGGQRTDSLQTHLQYGYDGGPVYVRVSSDGLARQVYRDKNGKVPLSDETLLEIVRNLRFNPALERGRPVDSLVKVKADSNEA